ncbi:MULTISPECIES: ROK family protein [Rhodococcus]|uniref:ROK family protein n=1 Tax=Rhodococcus TaxID=1827 RepID=UPI00038F9F1A|nr:MULTISPECIES: ROK family protein [Rhodococcus]ERB54616.1 sugar kinase [Rhodococcus sp. P27]MCW0192266.1 ROK family protein [Rhodococcus sp. (in: high G+C Gram-positive bacteria)]MBF7735041.1 ROK family protein [Rhodococcus erythropolis]MBS2991261.1 ROK family protein [Rhodococcus erythropolis]MCZ4642807.1 ROK family protein [Rhodococcus erythropolis]
MRLALDIGGTKMAAGVVSEDGRVPVFDSVPTPQTDPWGACAALLERVADGRDVDGVGIACAGPVDTVAGVVAPINITEWAQGFELVAGVRSVFPDAGTALAMDGAAAALAEFHHGAGRGTPNLLSLVVSTGIGGGIVLGGEIARGRTGNAGHIGHLVAPGSSEPCSCGGVGCLETVASGPSAVRWARSQGWSGNTGRELAEGARSGDAIAVDALHRAGTALGGAIASAAALLDVDLAVIGGGFAQSGAPLWEPMLDAAARHARLSFIAGLRIVPAELGGAGTLTGAGLLALTAVI